MNEVPWEFKFEIEGHSGVMSPLRVGNAEVESSREAREGT